MKIIHQLVIFFIIISSLSVVLSENPVHSILFLILAFINSSIVLILFKIDFLSILLIIIYVGAIAVLFLFIVMMLNIKVKTILDLKIMSFFFLVFIFLAHKVERFLNLIFFDLCINNINENGCVSSSNIIDNLSNIDVFGQVLYNYYNSCFLIAGIILLVAIIGAISLTFKFRTHLKKEFSFRKLSRSNTPISFFL